MLKLLLDNELPSEMNVTKSKGINLSMLIVHLFTSVSECTPDQDLYPLTEIITDPQHASVSQSSICNLFTFSFFDEIGIP